MKKSEESLKGGGASSEEMIYKIREPQKKKKEKRTSKEIMAQNFPNLMRDINLHVQEAQQISSRLNSTRSTLGHIITFQSQ